jgi:hypothetical protein
VSFKNQVYPARFSFNFPDVVACRFCLLWSHALRLGSSFPAEATQSTTSLSRCTEDLSSVSTVIENNMERSTPGGERYSLGLCLLNLAPALLVSFAHSREDKVASGEPRGTGSTPGPITLSETFRYLSCCFGKKTLTSILSSASPSDDLYESVLLVIKRLQSRRHTENWHTQGAWELTASSTVDFLFGRHAFSEESSEYSTDLEFDGLLNGLLHDIAKMVQLCDKRSFARRLLWGCMADLVMVAPASELRHKTTSKPNSPTHIEATSSDCIAKYWLSWLLDAPFSDVDAELRKYAARKIAQVVVQDGFAFILSVFSSEKDLKTVNKNSDSKKIDFPGESIEVELQRASDRIAADFFKQIDNLMVGKCGISDSLLSFTRTKSTANDTETNDDISSHRNIAEMQRMAAQILASLCQYADLDHPLGNSIYTEAYRRLACLWASNADTLENSSVPRLPSTGAFRAISFGELVHFSQVDPRQPFASSVLPDQILACVFFEIWHLNSDSDKDTRYLLLENFIQSFLLERPDILARKRLLKETSSYFESKLAMFIGYLLTEKAKEQICLTAGFRDFLKEMFKDAKKTFGFESIVVGGSNVPNHYSSISSRSLEKKAITMCLDSDLIDRILAQVLPDDMTLKFFLREVLDMSFGKIMSNRKKSILKALVWELGGDEATIAQARTAINVGSIRIMRLPSTDDDEVASVKSGSSLASATEGSGHFAATQLVTSNFMYLMVNLVQHRWNNGSPSEQFHALRCLYELIDFLIPSAAAEYFPHILATVNTATVENTSIGCPESAYLRNQATKCLSKFVELVAGHQVEPVARNLMNIVVSLIPLLEESSSDEYASEQTKDQETRAMSVLLLEFLTKGELGRTLAPHFREIPFLPRIGILGRVHKALRDNGVDYDNLLVLSSGTQEGRTEGVSATDTSGTIDSRASSSSLSDSTEKVAALQKRLNTICFLLKNESRSVRNVALQHVIDLLRGNRSHFHALVENESITTTSMYLTTMFPDQQRSDFDGNTGCGCKCVVSIWSQRDYSLVCLTMLALVAVSPGGTVTKMMEILLTHCVQEGDPRTRILLATCLGEVGAIGEHHLGELHIGGSTGDDSLKADKWRLEQPPWQSRSAKYELELVTHHLVVGLKAASSSVDQHRIIFTIQQLLHQLDRATTQVQQPAEESKTTPPKRSTEMGDWLRGNLKEAKVLDILEPIWHYHFTEKVRRRTLVPSVWVLGT